MDMQAACSAQIGLRALVLVANSREPNSGIRFFALYHVIFDLSVRKAFRGWEPLPQQFCFGWHQELLPGTNKRHLPVNLCCRRSHFDAKILFGYDDRQSILCKSSSVPIDSLTRDLTWEINSFNGNGNKRMLRGHLFKAWWVVFESAFTKCAKKLGDSS